MTSYYDPDEYDEEPEQQKPGNDLRKLLKAKDKELKELQAKFAELDGQSKKRTAQEVFAAKGVNSKAARFYLAEGGDPSDTAAVDSWIKENGDLFGVEVQEAEPLSEDELAAADQQERVLAPRGRGGDSLQQKLKEVKSFGRDDREKLEQWIAQQQGNPLA